MRPIGFSTGALALADVPRALAILEGSGATAIELSALRASELAPLLERVDSLDLSAYSYVSFHAPSRFAPADEARIADALAPIAARGWPIILHPDAIRDPAVWRPLGTAVCVENMDKRKPIGRTLAELARVFAELPEATFCFDIGHARQVDRTMNEAYFLAQELGPRLRQLHVSEVNTRSSHDTLSRAAVRAFQKVARWVPAGAPLILETPAEPSELGRQMDLALEALAS